MTLKKLKNAVKILLTGDVTLPADEDVFLAGLEMAFYELANKCTALKLLTPDISDPIVRQGPGNLYIRKPTLPEIDSDDLDIDDDLVPALARILASYLSETAKIKIHQMEANNIIFTYEKKVDKFLSTYPDIKEVV